MGRCVNTMKNDTKARNWHKDRFIPNNNCVEKQCSICEKKFYLPKSKENNQLRCSKECNEIHRNRLKESRQRKCSICNSIYYPRKYQIDRGVGKYCSHKCQGIANEGALNKLYTGGKTKSHARCLSKRIKAMRLGNTITKSMIIELGNKQKWKCAICKCDIKNGYHRDHIYPLSKGGLHSIENLQLLCKYCNCSKKDKDPIIHMQNNGYLL